MRRQNVWRSFNCNHCWHINHTQDEIFFLSKPNPTNCVCACVCECCLCIVNWNIVILRWVEAVVQKHKISNIFSPSTGGMNERKKEITIICFSSFTYKLCGKRCINIYATINLEKRLSSPFSFAVFMYMNARI